MVAGRETFTRGREIFLRGRDVSGLWRETLLERVSATLGATIGATIGATTGVGIIFANLLIISFGVRGVTKNLQERCRGTSWGLAAHVLYTTPDVHGLYYCTIWLLCLYDQENRPRDSLCVTPQQLSRIRKAVTFSEK